LSEDVLGADASHGENTSALFTVNLLALGVPKRFTRLLGSLISRALACMRRRRKSASYLWFASAGVCNDHLKVVVDAAFVSVCGDIKPILGGRRGLVLLLRPQ